MAETNSQLFLMKSECLQNVINDLARKSNNSESKI